MAISASVTLSGSAGGVNVQNVVTKTGGALISINEAIPANQTDLLFNLNVDKDRMKMFCLVSDAALTIETNSSSAADDTISLVANQPLIWFEGMSGVDNPFASADVTAIYLTNTDAANLSGFILHDPTA